MLNKEEIAIITTEVKKLKNRKKISLPERLTSLIYGKEHLNETQTLLFYIRLMPILFKKEIEWETFFAVDIVLMLVNKLEGLLKEHGVSDDRLDDLRIYFWDSNVSESDKLTTYRDLAELPYIPIFTDVKGFVELH